MQWQDSLAGALGDLPEVLAKRSTEREREAARYCQAWQQAAAGLALALMAGAGLSACRCPPHAASKCHCEPSVLHTVQITASLSILTLYLLS